MSSSDSDLFRQSEPRHRAMSEAANHHRNDEDDQSSTSQSPSQWKSIGCGKCSVRVAARLVRGDDWAYPIFVLLLIAFPHGSSQLFVMWPWYGRYPENWSSPWTFACWLLVFNGLCAMIYWNYYLACTTDPGRVPEGYTSPHAESQSHAESQPRYCHRCHAFKPPRSHHCSICRKCTLKMDHHCPWINNCVGYYNQGHFVRFLIYVSATCSLLLVTLLSRMMYLFEEIRISQRYTGMNYDISAAVNMHEVVFLSLDLVVVFLVTMAVGILTIYQLSYLFTNTTTIESWEREKVDRMVRKEKLEMIPFPFDVGVYRNICAVLGDRPLWWLWPQTLRGTGVSFSVVKGVDREDWPPEAYYRTYQKSRNPFVNEESGSESEDGDAPVLSERIPLDSTATVVRKAHVRRGSEGWEVRGLSYQDREALVDAEMRKYVAEQQQQPSLRSRAGETTDEEDHLPLRALVLPRRRDGTEQASLPSV